MLLSFLPQTFLDCLIENMVFDVLILGGGVAGMSCALLLGSARQKPFAKDKKIGVVLHQKSSALDGAIFNNVLGIKPATKGTDILREGKDHLISTYPEVALVEKEKVTSVVKSDSGYLIETNKNNYSAKIVVVAVGPSNLFDIKGLNQYVIPHKNLPPAKKRIQLKNKDHLIAENMYAAGVIAGYRSQYAIAAGSGTQVATDILTIWNQGQTTMIHDAE